MSFRLPAAVHVPLNSCHSESPEAEPACASDTAPTPASIIATRRRDDLCQPSLRTIPFRHPQQSAAKRDINCLPIYSKRDTGTEPKHHLDMGQLTPNQRTRPAGRMLKRRVCPLGEPALW